MRTVRRLCDHAVSALALQARVARGSVTGRSRRYRDRVLHMGHGPGRPYSLVQAVSGHRCPALPNAQSLLCSSALRAHSACGSVDAGG